VQIHISARKNRLICSMVAAAAMSLAACGRQKSVTEAKNIFGPDDRMELDVTTFPGKAVGRLDGGCSGAIVGKRLALTAAHCVYDHEKNALRPDVKLFKAGYKKGQSAASAWISAVWIGSKSPEEERRNDWALLLLADPIGDRTGWFGIRADTGVTFPVTLNSAGYSQDKDEGEVAYVSKNCYAHKIDENNRLLHDCDGVNGVSGGPMYVMQGSDALILSMTVAEFRSGERSMHRDTYSHEYANIGTLAAQFQSALTQLKAATDTALATPEISNAFLFVNTNSSGAVDDDDDDGDQDDDDGDQGDDDRGGGGDNGGYDPAAARQALVQQVYKNSAHIEFDNDMTVRAASAIADYAQQNGFRTIFDQIRPVFEPGEKLADYAWQLRRGLMQQETAVDGVLTATTAVTEAAAGFCTWFESAYGQSSPVAADLRYPLYDLKSYAAKLTAHVTVQ
jgi:protease YdgD